MIIIGWFSCSVPAYLVLRKTYRIEDRGSWTVGTRNLCLVMCLLGGPAALLTGLISLFVIYSLESQKESRW